MSDKAPTVVLVHDAFAESASWSGVIESLHGAGVDVVAAANPPRSVTDDDAYLRDVIAGLDGPVLLVGHSYGGMVITEAGADNPNVIGLVYVAAFAPDSGESAFASHAIAVSCPDEVAETILEALAVCAEADAA